MRRHVRGWELVVTGLIAAEVALHVVWNVLGLGGPWATMVFGDVVVTVVPALAGVACVVVGKRTRRRERRAWLLLGAGCLAWAAGDAVWAYYEVVARREVPFPSFADVGFLGLIPAAAAAVVVFPAAPAAARSRIRTLADGLILAASLMYISWATVLGSTIRAGADNLLGATVAVAYPLGDLVIITAVLYVFARAPRGSRTPFALIGGGLVALAGADSGFLYLTSKGLYNTGSLVTVGWNLGFALIGLAAVRTLSRPCGAVIRGARKPRVAATVLPYAGVALTLVLAGVTWVREGTLDSFLFWNTMAIVVLVAARQLLGLLEIMELSKGLEATVATRTAQLQSSERRFRSLVEHSSDVVTVVGASGLITYQSDSVSRVFGYGPRDLIGVMLEDLIHTSDRSRVAAVLTELAAPDGHATQIEFRVRHRDGSWRHVDATARNLLADPSVDGLVLNMRDVSPRKVLEHQLTHQAFHDSLTGLANRALFIDRVQQSLERAARHGTAAAMLYLDLDGFKTVNDTHGHQMGDELLVLVAERLGTVARGADTVARLGGDEFAVLLEDVTAAEEAEAVALRILDAFETPFEVGSRQLRVHASIGISMGGPERTDEGELLRNADVAMYMAKGRGKGRHELFDPVMHAAVVERVEMEADLNLALERNELVLHYQPVVDLESGRITGAEALLRWDQPERGLVSPVDFIPVAEDSGLIVPIGRWVLEQACDQARRWHETHPHMGALKVSVNVSVRQLHEPGFMEDVIDILARTGLDPRRLVLEITESVLVDDRFDARGVIHLLKELGVELAIDDFGTGYSSLGYLRDLPIDVLKIDRTFVDVLGRGPEDSALARAIVKLSDTLGLRTVAEGVETGVHVRELVAMGCEFAQGFYYARPMEAGALDELLRSGRPLPVPSPPAMQDNDLESVEECHDLAPV